MRTYDLIKNQDKPADCPAAADDDERTVEQTLAIMVSELATPQQFETAREMIENAMRGLDDVLNSIRSQLDAAHERKRAHGEYADADWWRRANSALRYNGRRRQELQSKLGQLNRRRKQLSITMAQPRERSRDRAFIDAARALLPSETFARLWQLADEIEGGQRTP